eukprot:1528432-Rhodomonas_salina.1
MNPHLNCGAGSEALATLGELDSEATGHNLAGTYYLSSIPTSYQCLYRRPGSHAYYPSIIVPVTYQAYLLPINTCSFGLAVAPASYQTLYLCPIIHSHARW